MKRELPEPIDPMDRTRFPIDEWQLIETEYDPDDVGTTETLFAVGNGYIGLRGNPEEGRPAHLHGTFINGFHETWQIQHAEDAHGFARVGQTIVNVPDAKVLKIYVDDEPLLVPMADLDDYERSLEFRTGVLRRRLIWRTAAGKRVLINTTRMASLSERHLVFMTLDVTMLSGDAPVVISSQVVNRQDGKDDYSVTSSHAAGSDPRRSEEFDRRVLEPQTQWCGDGRLMLTYRCHESRMTLAVGADNTILTDNPYTETSSAEGDHAKHVYSVDAREGVRIHVEKLVAYHTSRTAPVRELADRCQRTLDRARAHGVEAIHDDQVAWLEAYWDSCDVELPGQPALQQAIRWNLFQLAQAAARAEGFGIAAKGVTGTGYSGHYFWDTEIYVMPFLTYTLPTAARCALRFRYTMLDAARKRATEMAQLGALYPWRTINGAEASAYYAAGTAQYHIDADIAYALMKYVRATDDVDFLCHEGVDMLVETARLWADLGFWRSNGADEFHIHAVTGPDEYTTVVSDNLFTNVMARDNLIQAAATVRMLACEHPRAHARMVSRLGLQPGEIEEWDRCAAAMYIPYSDALGVHPQDQHFLEREVWDLPNTPAEKRPLMLHYHPLVLYRFQVIKQADVVMAMFLQGDQFSLAEKRANFKYYDPITTGDSTLSAVVQAIMAAETGYHELALRYFYAGVFVDLDDRHNNAKDGVHVASTGGVWSALVYGFGGMRDYGGKLTFDPTLPREWPQLRFRLQVGNTKLRVQIRHDLIRIEARSGDPVTLTVIGEEVTVAVGSPVEKPLGSRRAELDDDTGALPLVFGYRPDGSVMRASIPRSREG